MSEKKENPIIGRTSATDRDPNTADRFNYVLEVRCQTCLSCVT
jgi:hypothetical protein